MLAVIAVVLLFRIFNALHDACVTRGLIPQRLYFRYDVLIPVSIIAVMIQSRWVGEALVQGIGGEEVPQWVFAWSDPVFAAPFVGAVIGVVLLHRVFVLTKAIANHTDNPG